MNIFLQLAVVTSICMNIAVALLVVMLMGLTQEFIRVAKKINHQLDRIEGVQAAQSYDLRLLTRQEENNNPPDDPVD